MNMRRLALAAALFCGLNAFATSTPVGFTDDLDAALASAKDKGKLVYICFSGSDWCHWCIKLEKEVFSDESFAESLKDDYELVFIDSPSDKSRLSETAKAKNPELTKKYGIRGFPTMLILDGADGSVVVQAGAYQAGGAKKYVEMLKDIRRDPGKPKREKALYDQWVKPLKAEYVKLMTELNAECGKILDAEMAKPENAGKSREDLFPATMSTVKASMTKFRALRDKIEIKAEEAPEEIRPSLDAYATSLEKWIGEIDKEQ